MIVLSATQSLTPAIERTRRILLEPFRLGTFLKLCAVAVFTEGFGGNFNFSSPSSMHHPASSPSLTTSFISSPPELGMARLGISAAGMAMIAGVVAASLVIGFALFYLITRLRFALFHCLAYQVQEIRPGWRLYREPANRFFWMNVAVALVFMFLVVLSVAPFVLEFVQMYRSSQAGGHLNVLLLLSLAFPLVAVLLVIALFAIAIDIVLRDFMLPHFALEDASAGAAWRAVRTRMAAEKSAFFLYAVLRILLPIAAMIALVIVLAIPMLILFAIFAALFAGLHTVLAHAGPLWIALEIVAGIVAIAIGLLLAISFGGPLSIWVRNFALLFYGGRYGMLGDVLFPPLPPPLYDASGVPAP